MTLNELSYASGLMYSSGFQGIELCLIFWRLPLLENYFCYVVAHNVSYFFYLKETMFWSQDILIFQFSVDAQNSKYVTSL